MAGDETKQIERSHILKGLARVILKSLYVLLRDRNSCWILSGEAIASYLCVRNTILTGMEDG